MNFREYPRPSYPEYRRDIALSSTTTQLLQFAKDDISRHRLDEALGLTSGLDKEGLEYFLARKKAAEQFMIDDVRERVDRDLEALITAYKKDYSEGSDRPYHIETGLTTILAHLANTPVRGLFSRTRQRRETAWTSAAPWRKLIQGTA